MTIGSDLVHLGAHIFAALVKGLLAIGLLYIGLSKRKTFKTPLILLVIVLTCMFYEDVIWILRILRTVWHIALDYKIYLVLMRLAWVMTTIRFQALAHLVTGLTSRGFKANRLVYILGAPLTIIYAYFLFFGPMHSTLSQRGAYMQTRNLESFLMPWITLYSIICILIPLFLSIRRMPRHNFPRLVKKQLFSLVGFYIIPYAVLECVQNAIHFMLMGPIPNYIDNGISGLFAIISTLALYICTKRIFHLRFLNVKKNVSPSGYRLEFVRQFRHVLDRLGQALHYLELNLVTRTFFSESFRLQERTTSLCVDPHALPESSNLTEQSYDQLLANRKMQTFYESEHRKLGLSKASILIRDEIEFDHFYNPIKSSQESINLLDELHADVLIPIIHKQRTIGIIVIDHNARPNKFFDGHERDEMILFAGYMAKIIGALEKNNIVELMRKEKDARDQLAIRCQEIEHYRESLLSFIGERDQRRIGIIIYRYKKFTFENKEARELIDIDPNLHKNDIIAIALNAVTQQVEQYQAPVQKLISQSNSEKLHIKGICSMDKKSVILIIHRPEAIELVQKNMSRLRNPADWNHALYLETTHAGRMINATIPGSCQVMLTFKIDLFKASFGSGVILLDVPSQDTQTVLNLLQQISVGQELHNITITPPDSETDQALAIFGGHPLIYAHNNKDPLLSTLRAGSILFIDQVHNLTASAQQHLLEFLEYGYFCPLRSDRKIMSDVKIICSTHADLKELVKQKKFNARLHQRLDESVVRLQSFPKLPIEAQHNIMNHIVEQLLTETAPNRLFSLDDVEMQKILDRHPTSLKEVQSLILKTIALKTDNPDLLDQQRINEQLGLNNPDILLAARLGKHALKDPKLMNTLWSTLRSQTKIAKLLGVNRSSVNRRCKEYSLQ
jgi:hypothetical protein